MANTELLRKELWVWFLLVGPALWVLSAQEPTPVDIIQRHADSVYAATRDRLPADHHRSPRWIVENLTEVRPDERHETALRRARSCLTTAGIEVDTTTVIRWWTARNLILLPAFGPAIEYRGVMVPDGRTRHVLVATDIPHRESTLTHEAVHALCADGCSHIVTTVADHCGSAARQRR